MLDLPRNLFGALVAFVVGILKTLTRVTAFVGKELTEVIRRPGVLVSLILGPFIIMSLFGLGYRGVHRPLATVVVLPAGADLPRDVDYYQRLGGVNLRVLEVTDDLAAARARLQLQRVDLVVVAPTDAELRFRRGEQSVISVEYNTLSPIEDSYVQLVAQQQVQNLNRTIIEQLAAAGEQYAVRTLNSPAAARIPPQVVAAPIRSETQNLAPARPSVMQFYAPAVLALVLQQMGVSLAALSIVRERLSGAMDIFRVAPLRALEILVGKYLAFAILNLLVAAAIIALMVAFLGVPLLGSPERLALMVGLLTFASLGLGLLISMVADSERQAVQLSMLVLLASVFLSGFVLPLEEFVPAVRFLAYALPVTHGIRLIQDVMLQGVTHAPWQLYLLGAMGLALFLLDALGLRRDLSRV